MSLAGNGEEGEEGGAGGVCLHLWLSTPESEAKMQLPGTIEAFRATQCIKVALPRQSGLHITGSIWIRDWFFSAHQTLTLNILILVLRMRTGDGGWRRRRRRGH